MSAKDASRPSRRQRSSGVPQVELLQTLLARLGVRDQDWDLLLVGDGSGSGWQMPCGWATTVIDSRRSERWLIHGGANKGSINFAEMMPYLHALTWYHATHGHKRLRTAGKLRVYVVTDSQVIATQGTRAAALGETLPKTQAALWAAMRHFEHVGYRLNYRFAPRSTSGLNWVADLLASLARRAVMDSTGNDDARARCDAEALATVHFVDPASGQAIPVEDINPDGRFVAKTANPG